MINVSSATKAAWMSDRKVNHLVVSFPDLNLTYENDSIAPDSLSWTEALCNADSMEFVGCIASSFGASIYNIPDNVKGQYIEVTFQAGNTDIIPIFKGYVDSVEIESDSLFKKIKAYDALYNAGQVDVASWYARLPLPMTLGDIRASLMDYVGLTEVEDTELPNDDVMIYRTLENPDTIKGLTVIKSICQLNGACGIINREGLFEYRYVKESMESSYQLLYYESLKYEEFYCNPIQRVQIREMEDDAGVVTSGTGNKYIVQANMFAYELATDVLYSMANNILDKINGFTYHPMRSIQNGLPFFEVGDTLECVVDPEGYGVDTFLILSRTLTGVQFCRDTFEARGTQNQSEYITDVQAQVNVLRRTTKEIRNLSTKIVDYILPTNIEESDIESGSNSNIIEFEFNCSSEEEKSSFYASVNFDIATDADLQTETYGDCTLTVTFIKDGTNVEVQTHTFGDGSYMLMLNYLLSNMYKGLHSFDVKFSLSGGSLSSLQVISAYLLAASSVEDNTSGDYDEYDITNDYNGEFADDVLVDGLENEDISIESYESGQEDSMIKFALASTPTGAMPDYSVLSEYFNSKYMLCYGQYYGEAFYRTNGYYRKKGEKGLGPSSTGKPVGQTLVHFMIPIKRITGYHFLKFKAKTIQNNGLNSGVDVNYVAAGVAYVQNGTLNVVTSPIERSVADWTEYSVGISTLPYVDYIVLVGCDGSPAYKNIYFAR